MGAAGGRQNVVHETMDCRHMTEPRMEFLWGWWRRVRYCKLMESEGGYLCGDPERCGRRK